MSLVSLSAFEPRAISTKVEILEGAWPHRRILNGVARILSCYHRVEFHGMSALPRDRPLIFVAKHPRTWLYTETFLILARACALKGLLPFRMMHRSEPGLKESLASWLRVQAGGIPAEQEAALATLRRRESLLVFPGGRREVGGPRDEIQWRGRRAYARLAALTQTPVVPLVILGADWQHPFCLPLGDGRTLFLPPVPLPVKLVYHFGAAMEPPGSADASAVASFSEAVAHATRKLLARSRGVRGR